MDPTGGIATGIKAVGPIASAARAVIKQMRLLGTYKVEWLHLDRAEAGFTAAELSDIEDFLNSDETRPLLSILAITLLAPDIAERSASVEVIQDAFGNSARRWCADRSRAWGNRLSSIWEAVLTIYQSGVPQVAADVQDAAQEFSDFIQEPFGTGAESKSSAARYLERLSDLASNITRVIAAVDAANHVREALADAPIPPIITYTETTKHATFRDLYVARSLTDEQADIEVDSADLGARGGPFRVVVQGAPGAGKSTFVRYLRQELAQSEDAGQAALLVTIRDYFNTARNQTLHEYLFTSLRSSLNVEIEKDALRDALTLGLMVVIFDGLDEITDTNLRAEMAARIASFGREYPAISILVTSRAVGYDRAPLPSKLFATLKLNQYSPEQSDEYVRRWFTFIERDDLIPEFERESQTVTDLRANPLLLSLLCVLYRERGSIPRRRRDIYANCADLLFHTWDSHRHINQPEELHANGDRIMQEIARWVYTSQAAQSGLPESVIQKCIGNYLRDTVGVEEGEARRRAGEFLEFCATRAWLLANIGSQYGERLFGFTHRTFFEYFAAEAFSRQHSKPEQIAADIVGAHDRDATSVLPELLLQAYDDKVDRGAAEVFKLICDDARDEVLVLRLMEGVPLPSRARAAGFSRVIDIWKRNQGVTESSFVSLLTLNPDARQQFITDYLLGDAGSDYSVLFLSAWCALDFAGRAHRYEEVWSDAILACAQTVCSDERTQETPALAAWLWYYGFRDLPLFDGSQLFALPTVMGPRVGYLWLVIEQLSKTQGIHESSDVLRVAETIVSFAKRSKSRISFEAGHRYSNAVIDRLDLIRLGTSGTDLPDGPAKWAVLYAAALLDETGAMSEALDRSLAHAFGPDPDVLLTLREEAADTGGFASETARAAAIERLRELPVWLRSWAKGRRSFVAKFGE